MAWQSTIQSHQQNTRGLICPLFPLVIGFAFLFWFYFMLDWPFQGHLLPIMIAQLATTIACMIMGAFFFFMTLDAARAMSFAGALPPELAFMGITFPSLRHGFIGAILA
ncbi:hypothetical protein [Vibrio sp. 03_296]|uniref:hypothetical protein n=1 Tax=Vibrio sp. 03_296 TaxID=2024409 RepID=UPI002D80A5AE|nr:hypothetical protein [Vibrio sp. 03_296]